MKQLQSHNARLQERIVTLSAEAEASAEANAALAAKQAATARPASAPPVRSPLDAHAATNVTASDGSKTRSKSPHMVAPAPSTAAAAEPKPKPSEADAKKDALVRSLQVRSSARISRLQARAHTMYRLLRNSRRPSLQLCGR